MESKYCKWYFTEYIDYNKWLAQSSCGGRSVVKKNSNLYKFICADNDINLCPKCGKIITVGALMD